MIGLIHSRDVASLLPHRAANGWVCSPGPGSDTWWIKVPDGETVHFSKLPLKGRWKDGEDGLIFRPGCEVPDYRIEAVNWEPLAKMLSVGTAKKTTPAIPPFPIGFGLVQCRDNHPVKALLCQWESFVSWADSVLAQRTECLKFALSDDGRCIVRGNPLPGIDGTGFYQSDRLWIPAGYSLPEFLWPELVASALELPPQDSAILSVNGDWELIRKDAWVQAGRASIRMNIDTASATSFGEL